MFQFGSACTLKIAELVGKVQCNNTKESKILVWTQFPRLQWKKVWNNRKKLRNR